jgi:hypothetical protein
LDAKCKTVSDCVLVGFEPGSCDGRPILLSMGGAALSKAGAANAELAAINAEYASRCANAPCSSTNTCEADVAPADVSCMGGTTCTATPRSCLPGPPDAATH